MDSLAGSDHLHRRSESGILIVFCASKDVFSFEALLRIKNFMIFLPNLFLLFSLCWIGNPKRDVIMNRKG